MKIALVGYARAGKDEVCQIIGDLVQPTMQMAFGDELKRMFHATFPDIKPYPKPRDGYEKFGKAMRDIDQNVWVTKLAKSMKKHEQGVWGVNFVITDVRQPNEADWCKQNGFILVKIHADDEIRKLRAAGDKEFNYVNESEKLIWMIDTDYLITNNGTRDELAVEVLKLLEKVGKK